MGLLESAAIREGLIPTTTEITFKSAEYRTASIDFQEIKAILNIYLFKRKQNTAHPDQFSIVDM